RLDGRHELLLAVSERRPVELDVDLALLGPRLDVLGQDLVAVGHEALEEPDAEPRLRLRAGQAPENVQAGGRAASDRDGTADELPARHQTGVEPLGELAKRWRHGISS